MIQRKDLLTFNFYKKEKFTGSFCGMRYLIQKEKEEDAEVFVVYTWRGPYGFAATDESFKKRKTFLFQEASLEEIAGYLNGVYEEEFGEGAGITYSTPK